MVAKVRERPAIAFNSPYASGGSVPSSLKSAIMFAYLVCTAALLFVLWCLKWLALFMFAQSFAAGMIFCGLGLALICSIAYIIDLSDAGPHTQGGQQRGQQGNFRQSRLDAQTSGDDLDSP